jgi:hypothetical protein
MSHSAFRRAGFVARCLSFLLLAFASVAVQAQYTPPYLSTPGTLATFVEDAAAQPVAPGADVAGTSAPLVEVRVSIFPFDAVHDLLAFTPGGASGDIYASFDTGNGRMTLRSTGGSARPGSSTACSASASWTSTSPAGARRRIPSRMVSAMATSGSAPSVSATSTMAKGCR